MDVRLEEVDGFPVLHLVGEFDSFETELVRQGFEACVADGHARMVFDLGEMTFANSTTIAYIITAQREVAAKGGRIVLARPQEFLVRTLATLGLSSVFTSVDSVEEAVALLKST
jgi:anti-anti-sigma factor